MPTSPVPAPVAQSEDSDVQASTFPKSLAAVLTALLGMVATLALVGIVVAIILAVGLVQFMEWLTVMAYGEE